MMYIPLVFLLFASLAFGLPFHSRRTDHKTGQEHIVLLNSTHEESPTTLALLAQLSLSPTHADVVHIYNNSHFHGFSARMNTHCLSILNNLTYISHLEAATNITSTVTTQVNAPWGLQRISSATTVSGDETALSYTYTYSNTDLGQGADIYILDTGIYTEHVIFGGRAQMGWSYDGNMSDLDGHGTHVAGIAGGAQVGVASKSNLIGVKALSGDGTGSSSDVIAGIDYTINRHNTQRTNTSFIGSALSLSLSSSGNITTLSTALSAATAAGIHIIVAAGNDASDACSFSPSNKGGTSGPALVVGSISPSATISSFSNTGPCVDVYAPGENIISAWPPGPGDEGNAVTKALYGTSMATPFVTGLVAYAMANATLAADVGLMKEWVRMTALSGIVVPGGSTVLGDEGLLASNGVVQVVADEIGFIGQ